MSREAPFEIVVERNQAFVARRSDGQLLGSLSRLELAVLKMLDMGNTLFEAKSAFDEVLPRASGGLIERIEMRFKALLGRGISVPMSLAEVSSLTPSDPKSSLRDLPGPRVLHWHVTRYCPRKCVYCYAEPLHGGRATDASISRERLAAIFSEASTLGAEHLVIAGSEPLLREDLPEVMGDAIAAGITPFLTTKHPIGRELAGRLAKAGVRHVSLSLDTASAEDSVTMIGSRSYPNQVRGSMEYLAGAGVAFSIQAVATSLNITHLDDVARMAAEAGALVMQVVPFETVRKPIANYSNSVLQLPDAVELRKTVEILADAYPSVRFEVFEKLGTGARAQFHCDIGMTKLFFLPNGVTHRCYKLVDDLGLVGKDLNTCSVAEAWHDPAFGMHISPPRELYPAATCAKCGRFDGCHSEGRCIYHSSVTNGTYYDQDRTCGGPYPADAGSQLVQLEAIHMAH